MTIINKKGEIATITLVLALVIVAALFYWIGGVSARECNNNGDCSSGDYCGSDFKCHETPKSSASSYFWPAAFLGASIIAAAVILRWRRNRAV